MSLVHPSASVDLATTLEPKFDQPLTSCALCGSPKVRPYDRDFRGVTIGRCGNCGLKFMNPQYTDEYLARYYSTYIQEELYSPEQQRFLLAQKTDNFELIERFARPGRLLSIGSGGGEELAVAKSRGWRPEGYDVDPATTERIMQRVGVTVHSGDLFAIPWESGAYDCVYLDQVLEHTKRPAEYLRLCCSLIKRGGLLYLGVPNINSLASTFKTLTGKAGLKGRRGKHYDTFHHLMYFSPGVLPQVLERTYGLRVLGVWGDPKPRPNKTWLVKLRDALDRRYPQLDSSFVVVARK